MKTKDIQEQINTALTIVNKAQADLNALTEQDDAEWECTSEYWAISSVGEVEKFHRTVNEPHYQSRLALGNVYETKELAEAALAQKKAYVEIVGMIKAGGVGRVNIYVTAHNELTTGACTALPPELYGRQEALHSIINNHADLYRVALGWPKEGE